MEGTVKNIVGNKGFGFIAGEDGKEYFFHREDFNGFFNDLVDDMLRGRKLTVTFEPSYPDKGPRASQVSRVDGGR